MQNKEVTCILTSCGRFDLLRLTLESFFKHNTYDVKEFWIYEDSGLPIPVEFSIDFPMIKWAGSNKHVGQIEALDILWRQVNTEYAFVFEDDWLFTREGFIEDSMAVMETNPKILMCWLKGLEDKNTHPIEWHANGYFKTPNMKEFNGTPFGIFKTSPTLWAWHRFNPALKRKADYDLVAPFSKHTTFDKNKGWKSEAAISQVYNKLGFTAAMLPHEYIKHIGEGRRV